MTIIYRGDKGAPLTSAEFDGNFANLDARVTDLEENPVAAVTITNISMSGSQMTVTLSDASSFTVTVPRATAFDSFEVAALPASPATGRHAYATDGRRSGETAGNGSGCPVYFDGTNWRTFYDNSVVAA